MAATIKRVEGDHGPIGIEAPAEDGRPTQCLLRRRFGGFDEADGGEEAPAVRVQARF